MTREHHRRRPRLDSATEAVLAALICEAPEGSLQKTQAVKLTYLADVVATHVLGSRITGSTYKAWQYGVVATEIYHLITSHRHDHRDDPLASTPFVVEEPEGFEDRQNIGLGTDPSVQPLPDDILEIVEFVSTQYGILSPAALGRLTKKLNDHISEWPSAEAVRVDEVAYENLPVGWDEVDLEIADLRLDEAEVDESAVISGPELETALASLVEH